MKVYILLLVFIMVFLILDSKFNNINMISSNFNYNQNNKKRRISIFIVCLILGGFSAVREGIGIDYSSYLIHIERIALGYPNYMELGFKYLAKFLMSIFNDAKYVLSVFSFFTIYFFIKGIYCESKNIKMSIFIFLTWGYYFFTFNTVRNYFALSIVFFASKYVVNKKYWKFILCIIIASLFHKSALICIPLYIIANRKLTKKIYINIAILIIILFLLKNQLREIVFGIYSYYEGSVYDNESISLLNIIKSLTLMCYGGIYYNKVKEDNQLMFYFNLNTIAVIVYTVFYWLPEVSRIGFYFNITSIIFISNLTSVINKREKLLINYMIYGMSAILFILLMKGFYSSTVQLLPYKTWLFN